MKEHEFDHMGFHFKLQVQNRDEFKPEDMDLLEDKIKAGGLKPDQPFCLVIVHLMDQERSLAQNSRFYFMDAGEVLNNLEEYRGIGADVILEDVRDKQIRGELPDSVKRLIGSGILEI